MSQNQRSRLQELDTLLDLTARRGALIDETEPGSRALIAEILDARARWLREKYSVLTATATKGEV